ncbi:3-hydroxybutyrate dehydrogenase [Crenobacter sp. SG2303]|uniref:3-hydroxybutyrate dehydrogenase n=1 Tax=Crenobacter oryzisoli TaxID=3056844 RepID=A0ABT7XIR1_9NEIS|nr:3-hydroxybutyrate dehydrogenase [Crenobacter sp. SG2303]MDN0073675.1 3-hydroxybutyrate dehydrogenase [Crenobacter sp. SG2303]
MTSLHGKTALITGSTSGIGLGIATALAEAGANIVLNGFGEIDTAHKQIAQHGVAVIHHGADLRRPDEITDMMAFAAGEFGAVDILVNNAGIQHVAPVDDFPTEKWDDVLAINLSAAFHTIRLALPAMREKHWGRIVNIASVHGLVASSNKSAYVASKHGLVGLTKTVALELAHTGITCNALCPGWVLTPLVAKQIEAKAREQGLSQAQAQALLLAEKQPSGAFVTPAQLGALTLFLASEAAAEVRGVAWTMDGGWTAQ